MKECVCPYLCVTNSNKCPMGSRETSQAFYINTIPIYSSFLCMDKTVIFHPLAVINNYSSDHGLICASLFP